MCFWIDRSNFTINRTGLSIHVTGSEFRTAVYQPIEKKLVCIAGLQPDHVNSLAVDIVAINPVGVKGVHDESLVSFFETTPMIPITDSTNVLVVNELIAEYNRDLMLNLNLQL